MRTGIVLDHGTPAFERLAQLTKLGLGGRISSGDQWISWIHIDDFLRAVHFIRDHDDVAGTVHVTAPEPIQNEEMMASLRSALHRPWSPPTPKPLVHLGARMMGTDPALALTGRRCAPRRLLEAGFEFQHATFESATKDLLQQVREYDRDKRLTHIREERIIIVPMARIFTAERTLQGQALSSFGAYACQAGSRLHSELKPGRRDTANAGRPVLRW